MRVVVLLRGIDLARFGYIQGDSLVHLHHFRDFMYKMYSQKLLSDGVTLKNLQI